MQKTCIDYLKMHSECTILMQFLKKISGVGPDPHLREGVTPSPTLPLSALRASVKPSASLVTCAPRQWRFWIRPCKQREFRIIPNMFNLNILDYMEYVYINLKGQKMPQKSASECLLRSGIECKNTSSSYAF